MSTDNVIPFSKRTNAERKEAMAAWENVQEYLIKFLYKVNQITKTQDPFDGENVATAQELETDAHLLGAVLRGAFKPYR